MTRALAGGLAALVLLAGAPHAPASTRPFTVDDLLAQESFGELAIDPAGRWLVFERTGRYDRLPRYDIGYSPSEAFAGLEVVDLERPGPARPLLARAPAEGHRMGPFSPSGRRLAVYRLRGRAWDFGVVEMASGAVRWLGITPHEPRRGRTLQWLGEDALLVIARDDRRAPGDLRSGAAIAERLPAWWAAAAQGGSAHTVAGSGVFAPLRQRDAPRRLLRLDLTSGEAAVLARGEFFDLELAPGGRRVALLESGPDIQPRADGPVRGPAGLETEASLLSLLDLETGVRTSVRPSCDMLPQLLAWSADGRALLAFARGPDGTWASGRLLRIESANGMVSEPAGEIRPELDLNPVVVRAGWMGPDPVVYGRAAGATRADWHRLAATGPVNLTRSLPPTDRRIRAGDGARLVLLAGGRLWRVDRQGRAEPAADAPARPAGRDVRGAGGARLANVIPQGSWMRLDATAGARLAWAAPGGLRTGPAAPAGAGPLVSAGTPAARFAWIGEDPHGVRRLLVLADGETTAAATVNGELSDTDPMRIEPVRHTGERGEPLVSWLFLPPRPAGAGPPPLIVNPYLGHDHSAGPRVLTMEDGFLGNLRMLTGHGYAVLMPSLPNPPGGMREPADRLAERILAVERAARANPRLSGLFDHERQALLGWSFGGYTVMAALTQTDHFRAAVAISGISDLAAYWSNIPLGRAVAPEDGYGSNWATGTVEATQPQMGGPPWSDPARHQRNSPLWQADRISTPLMLVHGWRDPIPYAGSQAMFSALFRQGKDAQLVTYWAAEHRMVSPGDVRDVWARTFAFLDAYLMPARRGPPSASPGPVPASVAPTLPPPPR